MPNKTKDVAILNEKENVKKASVNNTKSASKNKTISNTQSSSKVVKTTKSTSNKKTGSSKASKKTSSSSGTKKSASSSSKKSTSKNASKKTSTSKKTVSKTSSTSANKKTKNSAHILEYYDLPYRYNETIVKVLVQTPSVLFVYWDISDEDKQNYIDKYGEYFFNDTKPVLVIYNETLHYSFEVDINDFANSWYLHVTDSNCTYKVELGRRPINKYAKIDNYLYISSSNNMDAPNDHILFDSLNNNVYFRNLKTNANSKKDLSLSLFKKVGKIYDVQNFYKTMYENEDIDFDRLSFRRLPSS